ncbi:hypothetical protein Bca52824_092877 [Brassica carinata]|uniref:Uncharacterized protein n=1 Tax=Brassica carinata TaxID=52824 RepID=A0A8X7P747_BRACI|nr:hypothetical protein Bca52824_092877 [Brassica carinata]
MGVAVLNPQDCLKQPFSHMKYPRNHTASCPNRQKKPVPNRTRRSPPRNQITRSPPKAPPPPPLSSFAPKGTVIAGSGVYQRIGPDPCLIPSQIRLSDRKSKKTVVPFYAGPVTMTSPPPSDVPLPAFFTTKKIATDATTELIRMLRLDIIA